MKCSNPDRQQLMAIAAADAELFKPHSGLDRLQVSTAPASGPAASTETPLSNGARAAMIVRRASRLRFPTQRARQRFVDRHTCPYSQGTYK